MAVDPFEQLEHLVQQESRPKRAGLWSRHIRRILAWTVLLLAGALLLIVWNDLPEFSRRFVGSAFAVCVALYLFKEVTRTMDAKIDARWSRLEGRLDQIEERLRNIEHQLERNQSDRFS